MEIVNSKYDFKRMNVGRKGERTIALFFKGFVA
jgi:hypothetical protein